MSWRRSLPVLAADLCEAGLGDVEMLIEYHLPLTSQRADVVLAGAPPFDDPAVTPDTHCPTIEARFRNH